MLINIGVIGLAYLFGSIASAIVVCKLMGLEDPRSGGSGNPGTTNVLRMHGKKAALITLLGDVLKGVIPALIARVVGSGETILALAGMAAFLGHLYPVYFQFRGGKGVATLIGVLFAFHWALGLAFIGTWLCVAFLFRYSSLAAISAALLTPAFTWLLLSSPALVICTSTMTILLLLRHQANIKKLITGTESRIGIK